MNPHTPQHHDQELDLRLTRALAAVPAVRVPDDFAQRVLAQLPAQPLLFASAAATPNIARRVTFAAAAMLLLAMLLVARLVPATGHPAAIACTVAEFTFAAEFILLSLWLTLRSHLSQ
jgi:hypothetical protein